MTPLDSIAVTVEQDTGNLRPVLYEIRHALERLLENGEPTVIDLKSIPMAPSEGEALEATLGVGELKAELTALGPSEIQETALPGVWLVTHYNSDGELMAKQIEVTHVPLILCSQQEDIAAGLRHLESQLSQTGSATHQPPQVSPEPPPAEDSEINTGNSTL
jgi:hydrogenase-1 operon protein HyaF